VRTSQHLGRERDDLHELARAQLAATGPKMRVPMGSLSLPTITALLVSNLM